MGIRDSIMAAEAQRLMDHPLAKVASNVIQGVAIAAILGVGSISINKLDSIINSINAFNKDMALVQRDVRVLEGSMTEVKSKQDVWTQATFRLQIQVEQLEKDKEQARGRKEG